MSSRWRIFFTTAAAVLALDQLTKLWIVKNLTLTSEIPVIPGFFSLAGEFDQVAILCGSRSCFGEKVANLFLDWAAQDFINNVDKLVLCFSLYCFPDVSDHKSVQEIPGGVDEERIFNVGWPRNQIIDQLIYC